MAICVLTIAGCGGDETAETPADEATVIGGFESLQDFDAVCDSRCGFVLTDDGPRFQPHPGGVDPESFDGSVRRIDGRLLFDLRFGTIPEPAAVEVARDSLDAVLPERPAWLVRTRAESLVAAEHASLDGVGWTTLRPLSGDAYTSGLAAGRVERRHEGEEAAAMGPEDVLALETLPFYIPPVAAILTAVGQTPLAHLNLLAQSRGTPNAWVADIVEHPGIIDYALHGIPVATRVGASIDLLPISEAEYREYLERAGPGGVTVRQADLSAAPYFVDLDGVPPQEAAGLIPLVGGKAAGMATFAAISAETPPRPLAITVRAWAEHVEAFRPTIEALLVHPDFAAHARARLAALEGPADFQSQYAADQKSLDWFAALRENNPPGTVLGDVLEAGGLKRLIRDRPLDSGFETLLTETLQAQFAPLSPGQGIRFRSSSTAEDVPGFNGAGLYDSNTGFGTPPDATPNRTWSWALRKTWASYWSFEAFEERQKAGIDHFAGRMAVLVHPRFDDKLEDGNAVVTVFVSRIAAGLHVVLVTNAQPGAHSVTNPSVGTVAQPEIVRVEGLLGGAPDIERTQSSELADGPVFSDAELETLWAQVGVLAETWLTWSGIDLAEAQRPGSVVLDLELKRMLAGWPTGAVAPLNGGTIYKQVRPLDRAMVSLPELIDSPTPRDILTRVATARRRTCSANGSIALRTLEILTDPALPWGALHALRPFTSVVEVDAPDGSSLTVTHIECDTLAHPTTDATHWDLTLAAGDLSLEITPDGAWSLTSATGSWSGDGLTCETSPLVISASQYLTDILEL